MHSRRNIYRCLAPLRVHRDHGVQILDKGRTTRRGSDTHRARNMQNVSDIFLFFFFLRKTRIQVSSTKRGGDRGASFSHASKTRFQVNARINQRDIKAKPVHEAWRHQLRLHAVEREHVGGITTSILRRKIDLKVSKPSLRISATHDPPLTRFRANDAGCAPNRSARFVERGL